MADPQSIATNLSRLHVEQLLHVRLQGWNLYHGKVPCWAHPIDGGDWCVGFGPQHCWDWQSENVTHLDMQVSGPVLYLLLIAIERRHRGKGLGRQLYEIVEDFARDMGCEEVWQTPSGTTARGEERADYLVRVLGYRMDEGQAKKSVRAAAAKAREGE